MSRPRPHPLFAVLCALFLLGAQQAAYAHFLGHLGFAQHVAAQENGDAEHDGAPSLAHVCTTCAAFAALDAAPPTAAAALPAEAAASAHPAASARVHVPAPAALPYAARAPPAVL